MDKTVNLFDIPTTSPENVIAPKKQNRRDGWESIQKSIGVRGVDHRTTAGFKGDNLLDKQMLSEIYTSDGLVAKIVDSVADDMFRPWGTVQNDDKSKYDEGLIVHEMNRLEVARYFVEAKKYARLMGGAIIYIGVTGSGAPDTPLNFEKVKSIEFLKVFDLSDIMTWDCVFEDDMRSPNFGKIKLYSVKVRVGTTYKEMRLHASRCIPFYGRKLPPSTVVGNLLEVRHWGISILQGMYSDIKDYRLVFANTANIISEFLVSKYKFSDLDEILSAGNEAKLQARIMGIEMSKSLINAVMLGTDEDYIRDSASVAGLADLLDRFMMQVSAVSGIPVTRLFGRSASGLNATGEGDQKAYYDLLASEQRLITPEVQRIIQIIAAGNGMSVDEDYTFKWGNLNQLTSEQIANEERIKAETLRTNADAAQRGFADGVLNAEQIYNWLYKDTIFEGAPYVEPELPEEDINAENDRGNVAPGQEETIPSTT